MDTSIMALFHYCYCYWVFSLLIQTSVFPNIYPVWWSQFRWLLHGIRQISPLSSRGWMSPWYRFWVLIYFRTTWILWFLFNFDFFSKSLSNIKLINTFCKYIFFSVCKTTFFGYSANQTNLTPEYIPKFTFRAYFGFFFGSTF